MIFKYLKQLIAILFLMLSFFTAMSQGLKTPFQSDPWKDEQLISPDSLAGLIDQKAKVKIYNIGVVQNIKGAIHLGAASEIENLEKLRKIIKAEDRGEFIVIYCGCCPMNKCPNIRPAFRLFMEEKFTNTRLLDLPVNIKMNWIDKGYPVE
jgi:hypothetical protein